MLEKAIQNGWTSFITGMATGFDTIAAETVLELKNKYKDVKLYGAIPHPGQESKWTDDAKDRYKKLNMIHLFFLSFLIYCDFLSLSSSLNFHS